MQNIYGDTMKKFTKIVNITAMVISVCFLLIVVISIFAFSKSSKIDINETKVTIEQVELTRRKVNNNISFYAENVEKNSQYYVVMAFELYEIEDQSIYLTVKDSTAVYLITVNENSEASVVYNQI